MRWLRGITATLALLFGMYAGYRAVTWVGARDYVLALSSALVAVASMRAGVEIFASETAE